MAAERSFFLSHSLTSGVNISMSRAVFTTSRTGKNLKSCNCNMGFLSLPSLFTIYYTEVTVACQDKNAITFIYFCSHYHRDIKSQDKNCRLRNVLCCTQNCTRGVVLEGEWLHYLGEISSPSLFWGRELQVC